MSKLVVELNKQEIWRILDALVSFKKDYAVSANVSKTINGVEKKLKNLVKV